MKKYPKKISILLAFIIVFTTFLSFGIANSYGTGDTGLIEVQTYGNQTQGDPMFSEGLWGPGSERSGIMRIKNNYSQRIRVNNLSLIMTLEKSDGTLIESGDAEGLYQKYAESMKLNVTRGKWLVFKETVFNGSFYEMLQIEGQENHKGYTISAQKQFNVSRNDSVDLKYTVTMDGKEAGNELQGLKATVDFNVNLHENAISEDSSGQPKYTEEEDTAMTLNTSDINGHWAEDCILKLIEAGIIVGYPDGTIKPDNIITRAETAVLITKALKLEEKDKFFSGYLDPIPKWARGSIIATTEEGIFEGYPVLGIRLFRGNKHITREEMATVLMRGFEIALQEDIWLNFNDKDNISDWALEYVKAGVQKEIILGYPDDSFKPQNNITRAEAFTMICKLLGDNK